MGDTHSSNDTGGANRARPHTDFDGIDTRRNERLCPLASGDVASNNVDLSKRWVGFDPADDVNYARTVAVSGVDDEHVDTGVSKFTGAVPGISKKPDGRGDAKPAVLIFGGVGVFL